MDRKKVLLLAYCFLFVLIVSPVVAGEVVSRDALRSRIDSILKQANADRCKWALEVVSLDTGETLYERNADLPLTPASNTKLFTTAAALRYLGPDFTVKTSFYFDGDVDGNGILHGNLIIYGRGDPNISGRFSNNPTSVFEQIADSLKTLGLREVSGDVVGDDSCFDSQYYGPWLREESGNWYAARVSALSFNDNCMNICVSPGAAPGTRANVSKYPKTSYGQVINRASTTSSRKNGVWATCGGDESDESAIIVNGKIWTGRREEVVCLPVAEPTLYAATVFKETLEHKGIRITGKVRVLDPGEKSAVSPGMTPIFEHESLPLSEMIKVVNKRSQNLHAELLLKQVGLKAGLQPSFDGGARAVDLFLREVGVPPESVSLHDGSGLCRSNRVTVHSIIQLLKFMDESKWRDAYRDSLAVAGIDNSLRSMYGMRSKVIGKTGSLDGVSAFSGYVNGETERLAISMIVNGYKGGGYRVKQVRDKICKELAQY